MFVLSHRNVPLEFLVNDTKITLYDQKMFFSESKLYPYIFKPFLPERKIFVSNFFDLSFER